jgi:hypothetical protein
MHLGLGGFRRQSRNVWELPCWPTEAEFLDEIWKKTSKSFPPCYSQSPLLTDPPPPPLDKSGLKLMCTVM